jgi:hypothetical protein
MDWAEIAHMWDRAKHHVFMDGGFTLMSIVGLLFLIRRKYIPTPHPFYFFLLAGSIPMVIAWLREPFDVAAGQSVAKVITDWISHLAHWVWIYLLYRFSPTLAEMSKGLHDWFERRKE